MIKSLFQVKKVQGARAQAIVEFALVLMILMVILVGILEVGRLVFMYAAVNNASREAARYASAYGLDDSGNYLKYQYCQGIHDVAQRSAFFTPLTVTITYDSGPNTSSFHTCTPDSNGVDTGVSVNNGTDLDRVKVTVSANYSPMVNLIPIGTRTISSESARTIFGLLDLDTLPTPSRTPTSSGPTSTGTIFPTSTHTATATATATIVSATPTATLPVGVVTMTPLPTSTPTLVPTITASATITHTSTSTLTPTLTFTATSTPTPKPGCDSITTGSIAYNGKVMSLSIANPHDTITVQSVQVVWNATNGGAGNKSLVLKTIKLGSTFWAGSDSSGNLTITPSTTVTIPGNNQTSYIEFTFDNSYQNKNGTEAIAINLSTPGCESYTIRKP